jgi:hypothetical protein
MELFTDIVELRGSVNMVRKYLESSEDECLETAAHFMSKSVALIQVLEESFVGLEGQDSHRTFLSDKSQFLALKS